MAKVENNIPNFCVEVTEFNPNVIHNPGLRKVLIHDDSAAIYTMPSIVDKESYRITLASMRGMIPKLGSSHVGSYSLKDGKYNPDFDFSYLNRPDLTIVDIKNYIDKYKSQIENYDNDLKVRIQEELDKADAMLKEKVSERKETNSSGSSE